MHKVPLALSIPLVCVQLSGGVGEEDLHPIGSRAPLMDDLALRTQAYLEGKPLCLFAFQPKCYRQVFKSGTRSLFNGHYTR